MRKYLAFIRLSIQNALAYRGPMTIWLASNLLLLISMVAVWSSASGATLIAGYSKNELISYYVVGLFLQWFNGWFPFYWIRTEIRDGSIAGNTLTKPISFYWRVFAGESGWHIVSTPVGLIASIIVIAFVPHYFIWPRLVDVWLAIIAAVLSIFVVVTMSICMGLLAFWLTNLNTIYSTFWATRAFLGGQAIPLSFLPASYLAIINFLPFRYMFSFPLEVYFNKLSGPNLILGFITQLIWILLLTLLYSFLWTRARKAYAAFGN